MSKLKLIINNKYLIDKTSKLIKFCFVIALLCLIIIKAPNETSRIIEMAGAFILGGSNIRSKIGF